MSEKKREAELWVIKGDHDLGTARITFKHIPEFIDTVTFHCQQAVEKYLKAYLIYLGVNFRFTHDLIYLLDLINESDSDFRKYYNEVAQIQGYAVEIRYPNETIYLTSDKVESALQIAAEIRTFVLKKMNLEIESHPVIRS